MYLLFRPDADYTTDEGKPCSFGDHLQYLRRWGGSPDMFDNTESLLEAKQKADRESFRIVVIDEDQDYRPVYSNRAE